MDTSKVADAESGSFRSESRIPTGLRIPSRTYARRSLLVFVTALLGAACISTRQHESAHPRTHSVEVGGEGIDTSLRRLYRVAVSGPDGRGSLRVALVVLGPSSYSMSASDTFGRSMWDLRVDPRRSFLIDHRHDAYCEIDAIMPLPGDTLGLFPLAALPALLLGRLLVAPNTEIEDGDGGVEFRDEMGRRWTAEWKDSELKSWTLWQNEEPRVWWTRQPKGGILSNRLGSQIRWRQTLEENLQDDFRVPELPAEYEERECIESDLPELSDAPTRSQGSRP